MTQFLRLLKVELLKLRRSPALRIIWLMPLLFVGLEFAVFERPFLGLRSANPGLVATLGGLQVKMLVALWAGFFHPLLLAILPALIFQPEHRHRTWRYLHAQPVSRRMVFLAKASLSGLLTMAALALILLLLWSERMVLGHLNPWIASPFQGRLASLTLGWLLLGSLPLMSLYAWTADRINSLAVPIVFGLLGLLLTIALTGQELNQAWRRDLIPWILPYAAAERTVHQGPSQQEVQMAGKFFQPEPNVIRLPSGRKIRTWQNIPDDQLFPPPPPTPRWLMAVFGVSAGILLLVLGWADAGRERT